MSFVFFQWYILSKLLQKKLNNESLNPTSSQGNDHQKEVHKKHNWGDSHYGNLHNMMIIIPAWSGHCLFAQSQIMRRGRCTYPNKCAIYTYFYILNTCFKDLSRILVLDLTASLSKILNSINIWFAFIQCEWWNRSNKQMVMFKTRLQNSILHIWILALYSLQILQTEWTVSEQSNNWHLPLYALTRFPKIDSKPNSKLG